MVRCVVVLAWCVHNMQWEEIHEGWRDTTESGRVVGELGELRASEAERHRYGEEPRNLREGLTFVALVCGGRGSVLMQMQYRMKRDLDDELMDKWKAARESITCEAQHVKELSQV